MSVKRYQPVAQFVEPSYQAQMIVPKVMEFSEGEYVLHSDYARLKAEVERLRKFNDESLAHIAKEERKSRERLDMEQAEVERLIKAGDALILALDKRDDCFDNSDKRQAIADWNAAKEGKQP